MRSRFNPSVLPCVLLLWVVGGAACTSTETCRPGTALLKLPCPPGKAPNLFEVALRRTGESWRSVEPVLASCPETIVEIRLKDLAAEYEAEATPVGLDGTRGDPVSAKFQLMQSCVVVAPGEFATPGAPKVCPGAVGCVVATPSPDGGSPLCDAGTLGCSCKELSCSAGLECQNSVCVSLTCGNATVELGEECDDGNSNDVDLCSLKCEPCSKRAGFLACGASCLESAECCPGTPCGGPGKCADGMVTLQSICGADGKCPVQKLTPCDSFLTCLNVESCRSACSADVHCTSSRRCQGGTCITPSCGNGMREGDEQCDDGNNNDSDLCSNACVSCAARANFQACGERCISGATCCPGSICAASSCSGSSYTPEQTCNSTGQCPTGVPSSCAGHLTCEGTSCRSSCSATSQCANNRYCFGGLCVECASDIACNPGGDVCKAGKTSCASGQSACVPTGDSPLGTSCGNGSMCTGGLCVTCAQGSNCDRKAPTGLITPNSGTSGVLANAVFVVTFSEPMDKVATQNAYQSADLPASAVTFSFNGEGTVLTIKPNAPLTYATASEAAAPPKMYSVGIGTGATDVAGNALMNPVTTTVSTLRRLTLKLPIVKDLSGHVQYPAYAISEPLVGPEIKAGSQNFGGGFTAGFVTFDLAPIPPGAGEVTSAIANLYSTTNFAEGFFPGATYTFTLNRKTYSALNQDSGRAASEATYETTVRAPVAAWRSWNVTASAKIDVAMRGVGQNRSQYELIFRPDLAEYLYFSKEGPQAPFLEIMVLAP